MSFKQLILGNMPSNLSDLEKARFIYLKLAMYLNFSTKFQNTSDKEFAKMYTNKSVNIDSINTNQIICKWWARIYSSFLNEVGIKNEIVDLSHEYVIFYINGKKWVADATNDNYTDLARIKYGDESMHFGVCFDQKSEEPYPNINYNAKEMAIIAEIDKKFKFYQMRIEIYKQLKSKLLTSSTARLNITQKIELMFETIGKLYDGYYESKEFVKQIEYDFFSEEEMKHIHAVELKRTNKNLEVDIIQCIYVKTNDEYSYYLLAPNLDIRKVNPKDIRKLAYIGYGIDQKKIPGVIFPRIFKPGIADKKLLKYRIFPNTIPLPMQPYNKEQLGRII